MKYYFKEKLSKKERVTLSLLAKEIGVTQGTLSNYLSGKRRIPFNLACRLETITGINGHIWLKVSYGQEDAYKLKKLLGFFGRMSERKLADDNLRENFNKYINNQNKHKNTKADWREIK